jgi:cell division protein FtsN
LQEKRLFLPRAAIIILGMHRKKPFHYKLPGNTVKQTIAGYWGRALRGLFTAAICWVFVSCAAVEESPKKNQQLGLITTPPTYYTTQRARYLGERYKNNLDRLVERIVRNPKTANLQFANNIASVGGIGFFTHSAAGSFDERFLEVIMGVPDTFDTNLDHSAKVSRVFSLYGTELLSILVSDPDIYQEKEVNGYGLNLSWRNLFSDAAGPRISLERAVLYFSKARAHSFLRGDLTQSGLLGEAVMFAVVDDGPMKLVSYRPQALKPDWRAPIQEEEILGAGRVPAQPEAQSGIATSGPPAAKPSIVEKEQAKSSTEALLLSNEKLAETTVDPGLSVKPDHGVVPSVDEPKKVPVGSSLLMEPSEPVVQTKEAMVKKQDSIDRDEAVASLEQKRTVPQQAAFQSKPALPETTRVPTLTNVPTETKSMAEAEQWNKQETLASKSVKPAIKEEPMTRSLPQVLQGFVIQLAFSEMREALRWAEILERRGFAVSLTEASSSGSVRVRIGSFAGREEAERQLQALRQDGLKGILVNLPQAYRPQVQPVPTEPEPGDKTVSASQ